MNNSKPVGDSSQPTTPPGVSPSNTAGISSPEQQKGMQAPVSNLGDLKATLIAQFGEEDGTKLYNNFMTSFAMLMLQQMQASAAHAKEASMRARHGT